METESLNEEYSITWKGHVQHVKDSFAKLLQNSSFCDVTLYVEGRKIGAHKAFLASCSGYFYQLFKDIKEERPIIVLKGVQFDILQHILRFMYEGQVNIEKEQFNEFLKTAEFLEVSGLIRREIISNIATNVVDNRADQCSIEKNSTNIKDLDTSSKDPLTARLLQTKGYSFFKEHVLPSKAMENRLQEPDIIIDNPALDIPPEMEPSQMSSPYVAQRTTDDWTSDYEYQISQSTQSTAVAQDPIQATKRRKIKLERCNSNLEVIREVDTINQTEFANTIDEEFDFSDVEDDRLEKELLKTSLAGTTEEGIYMCNICHRTYVKKDSLKKHFAVHTKGTSCNICGLVLSRQSHLKRHLRVHGFGKL